MGGTLPRVAEPGVARGLRRAARPRRHAAAQPSTRAQTRRRHTTPCATQIHEWGAHCRVSLSPAWRVACAAPPDHAATLPLSHRLALKLEGVILPPVPLRYVP
ncbi:hypothetical protein HF086_009433 [Spodoptera exigua]|uniref:Uncharacterized protein n=1 Tax=Spodoptera exigua TaxID=7107 RepID=A0A922MGD4_SPOEX|nr:hypothetical protein HF086_009432 [Spodoptera exigua]KAH9636237.1 hypothetical protein HF086_009433 [Spodoptera exigua]